MLPLRQSLSPLVLATVIAGGGGGGGGSSAYKAAVLADSPLVYWRLDEPSGTTMADTSGNSHGGTYGSSGVTLNQTGALTGSGDSDAAAAFDGSSGYASAALNLSALQTITVEFWLKVSTWTTTDLLAMEFSPNFNSTNGCFLIDPNSSSPTGFNVVMQSGGYYNASNFSCPSSGTWHHYAFVLDMTASPSLQVVPYVDGSAVSYAKAFSNSVTGSFANTMLYLMSRAGSSLLQPGTLDEVAIYPTALSATRILAHYNAGI